MTANVNLCLVRAKNEIQFAKPDFRNMQKCEHSEICMKSKNII